MDEFCGYTAAVDLAVDVLSAELGQEMGARMQRANIVATVTFGSGDKLFTNEGSSAQQRYVLKKLYAGVGFRPGGGYDAIRMYVEAMKMCTSPEQFTDELVPVVKASLGDKVWAKLVEDGADQEQE